MPRIPILTRGTIISNRYRVLRPIGEGGASRVYQVEHKDLGTIHALKQQSLDQQDEGMPEVTVESAQREARFLSTLSHPSLPKVTDFFREGNDLFLVMDFVDGQNLKEILDQQGEHGLDIQTVARWGTEICDILTYLHSQDPPIIFRDVKPANLILRPDGGISIVDFGIARQVRKGAASDTIRFGSEGYAPPEQYGKDGQGQTEPRSDIYALGATLHHLLTGRDPSNAPFKWPTVRALNPLVPLVLDKLVMRCVEMEVTRRPESAEAVSRSLRMGLQLMEEANRSLASYSGLSFTNEVAPLDLRRGAGRGGPAATLSESPQAAPTIPIFDLDESPALLPKEEAASAPPVRRTPFQRFLKRLLTGSALLVLLLGLGYPLINPALAPVPAALIRPYPAENPDAERLQADYLREQAAKAETARSVYESLTPLRYTLALLTCLSLIFGVLRPLRSARLRLVLTTGGFLGLLCLTGATFLPDRVSLFFACAFLESLLLMAAFVLYLPDTPEP